VKGSPPIGTGSESADFTIIDDEKRTFLHINATFELWTAYFVMTSRILEYSSDGFLIAERRVGVL